MAAMTHGFNILTAFNTWDTKLFDKLFFCLAEGRRYAMLPPVPGTTRKPVSYSQLGQKTCLPDRNLVTSLMFIRTAGNIRLNPDWQVRPKLPVFDCPYCRGEIVWLPRRLNTPLRMVPGLGAMYGPLYQRNDVWRRGFDQIFRRACDQFIYQRRYRT